jgi:hypothetical protein
MTERNVDTTRRRWVNWAEEEWVRTLLGEYPSAAYLAMVGAPITLIAMFTLVEVPFADRMGYLWWGRVLMAFLCFGGAALIAVFAVIVGSSPRLPFSDGMRRFSMAYGYVLLFWVITIGGGTAISLALNFGQFQ